jgi:hypothetical protein
MLSSAEIARGMQGAVRFLQRDPAAPFYFDDTFAACLRSFRVMVLAAPLYALYVLMRYSRVEVAADGWEIAAVEALRYVVDWLLFPVIFYEIARRRGWLERYPRYIAALNWIGLPVMVLLLASEMVDEVAPTLLAVLLAYGLQALFFYWFLMVTRIALAVGWLIAGLLLIVNWMPSLFLSLIVERFLGVTAIAAG